MAKRRYQMLATFKRRTSHYAIILTLGRDGRADEGAGLENQYGINLIVGSNPTLSVWEV